MADADSTEVVYKIRQWSLPGATVVPVLNVSSKFSGLNWMVKLSWTAILCYRRASFVMCFRRSVQLFGRALVGKGLRLPSCCRAVKMRMTGSISCCRKRTYGPLLQPGVLSQRSSPNRSFVRSGGGCRPSICEWRSSCVGVCLLTECTRGPYWEVQTRTRCSAFWQGCQAQPHESVWRKSLSWTCTQRSPSMVGTMQRLDVIFQRLKCAVYLWLSEPFKGSVW